LVPFNLQDKHILLRVLKFAFLFFFLFFFGTITSEHTCLRLRLRLVRDPRIWALREQETYIFTYTPLCGICTIMTHYSVYWFEHE